MVIVTTLWLFIIRMKKYYWDNDVVYFINSNQFTIEYTCDMFRFKYIQNKNNFLILTNLFLFCDCFLIEINNSNISTFNFIIISILCVIGLNAVIITASSDVYHRELINPAHLSSILFLFIIMIVKGIQLTDIIHEHHHYNNYIIVTTLSSFNIIAFIIDFASIYYSIYNIGPLLMRFSFFSTYTCYSIMTSYILIYM
jgi:hypothetical protein